MKMAPHVYQPSMPVITSTTVMIIATKSTSARVTLPPNLNVMEEDA